MHEMSIAMNVVEIVCQKAKDENATIINSIELEVGELAGVTIDSLEFCFDAVCKNSMAEGAILDIKEIKAEAFCKTCNKTFRLKSDFSPCPNCNEYTYEIRSGKELSIKSFNID